MADNIHTFNINIHETIDKVVGSDVSKSDKSRIDDIKRKVVNPNVPVTSINRDPNIQKLLKEFKKVFPELGVELEKELKKAISKVSGEFARTMSLDVANMAAKRPSAVELGGRQASLNSDLLKIVDTGFKRFKENLFDALVTTLDMELGGRFKVIGESAEKAFRRSGTTEKLTVVDMRELTRLYEQYRRKPTEKDTPLSMYNELTRTFVSELRGANANSARLTETEIKKVFEYVVSRGGYKGNIKEVQKLDFSSEKAFKDSFNNVLNGMKDTVREINLVTKLLRETTASAHVYTKFADVAQDIHIPRYEVAPGNVPVIRTSTGSMRAVTPTVKFDMGHIVAAKAVGYKGKELDNVKKAILSSSYEELEEVSKKLWMSFKERAKTDVTLMHKLTEAANKTLGTKYSYDDVAKQALTTGGDIVELRKKFIDNIESDVKAAKKLYSDIFGAMSQEKTLTVFDNIMQDLTFTHVGRTSPLLHFAQRLEEDNDAVNRLEKAITKRQQDLNQYYPERPISAPYITRTTSVMTNALVKRPTNTNNPMIEPVLDTQETKAIQLYAQRYGFNYGTPGLSEGAAAKKELANTADRETVLLKQFKGAVNEFYPYGHIRHAGRLVSPVYNARAATFLDEQGRQVNYRPIVRSPLEHKLAEASPQGYGITLNTMFKDVASNFEDQLVVSEKVMRGFITQVRSVIGEVETFKQLQKNLGLSGKAAYDIVKNVPEMAGVKMNTNADAIVVDKVQRIISSSGSAEKATARIVETIFNTVATKLTTRYGSKGTLSVATQESLGVQQRPASFAELVSSLLSGKVSESFISKNVGQYGLMPFMGEKAPKGLESEYKDVRENLTKVFRQHLGVELANDPIKLIKQVKELVKTNIGEQALTVNVPIDAVISLKGLTKRLNLGAELVEAQTSAVSGGSKLIIPNNYNKQVRLSKKFNELAGVLGYGQQQVEGMIPVNFLSSAINRNKHEQALIGNKFFVVSGHKSEYSSWDINDIRAGKKGAKLNPSAVSALLTRYGVDSSFGKQVLSEFIGRPLDKAVAKEFMKIKQPSSFGKYEMLSPDAISGILPLEDADYIANTILDPNLGIHGKMLRIPKLYGGAVTGKTSYNPEDKYEHVYIPKLHALDTYEEQSTGVRRPAAITSSYDKLIRSYNKLYKQLYGSSEEAGGLDIDFYRAHMRKLISKRLLEVRETIEALQKAKSKAERTRILNERGVNDRAFLDKLGIFSGGKEGIFGLGRGANIEGLSKTEYYVSNAAPKGLAPIFNEDFWAQSEANRSKGVKNALKVLANVKDLFYRTNTRQEDIDKDITRQSITKIYKEYDKVKSRESKKALLGSLNITDAAFDYISRGFMQAKDAGEYGWKEALLKAYPRTGKFESLGPGSSKRLKEAATQLKVQSLYNLKQGNIDEIPEPILDTLVESINKMLKRFKLQRSTGYINKLDDTSFKRMAAMYGLPVENSRQAAIYQSMAELQEARERISRRVDSRLLGKGGLVETYQNRVLPAIAGNSFAAVTDKIKDFSIAIASLKAAGLDEATKDLESITNEHKRNIIALRKEGVTPVLREGEIGVSGASYNKLLNLRRISRKAPMYAEMIRYPFTGSFSMQTALVKNLRNMVPSNVVASPGMVTGVDFEKLGKVRGSVKERIDELRAKRRATSDDAERAKFTTTINDLIKAMTLLEVKFRGLALNADHDGDTFFVHAGLTKETNKEMQKSLQIMRTGLNKGQTSPWAAMYLEAVKTEYPEGGDVNKVKNLFLKKRNVPGLEGEIELIGQGYNLRELPVPAKEKALKEIYALEGKQFNIDRVIDELGIKSSSERLAKRNELVNKIFEEKMKSSSIQKHLTKPFIGPSTESVNVLARIAENIYGVGNIGTEFDESKLFRGIKVGKSSTGSYGLFNMHKLDALLLKMINEGMGVKHGGAAIYEQLHRAIMGGTMKEGIESGEFKVLQPFIDAFEDRVRLNIEALSKKDLEKEGRRFLGSDYELIAGDRRAVEEALVKKLSFNQTFKDIKSGVEQYFAATLPSKKGEREEDKVSTVQGIFKRLMKSPTFSLTTLLGDLYPAYAARSSAAIEKAGKPSGDEILKNLYSGMDISAILMRAMEGYNLGGSRGITPLFAPKVKGEGITLTKPNLDVQSRRLRDMKLFISSSVTHPYPENVENLPRALIRSRRVGSIVKDNLTYPSKAYVPGVGEQARIDYDIETIKQLFRNQAWTKPQVEGVLPLPVSTFKHVREFKDFLISHEKAHLLPTTQYLSGAAKENYANEVALRHMGLRNPKFAEIADAIYGSRSQRISEAEAISKIQAAKISDNRLLNKLHEYDTGAVGYSRFKEAPVGGTTSDKISFIRQVMGQAIHSVVQRDLTENYKGAGRVEVERPLTNIVENDRGEKGVIKGRVDVLFKNSQNEVMKIADIKTTSKSMISTLQKVAGGKTIDMNELISKEGVNDALKAKIEKTRQQLNVYLGLLQQGGDKVKRAEMWFYDALAFGEGKQTEPIKVKMRYNPEKFKQDVQGFVSAQNVKFTSDRRQLEAQLAKARNTMLESSGKAEGFNEENKFLSLSTLFHKYLQGHLDKTALYKELVSSGIISDKSETGKFEYAPFGIRKGGGDDLEKAFGVLGSEEEKPKERVKRTASVFSRNAQRVVKSSDKVEEKLADNLDAKAKAAAEVSSKLEAGAVSHGVSDFQKVFTEAEKLANELSGNINTFKGTTFEKVYRASGLKGGYVGESQIEKIMNVMIGKQSVNDVAKVSSFLGTALHAKIQEHFRGLAKRGKLAGVSDVATEELVKLEDETAGLITGHIDMLFRDASGAIKKLIDIKTVSPKLYAELASLDSTKSIDELLAQNLPKHIKRKLGEVRSQLNFYLKAKGLTGPEHANVGEAMFYNSFDETTKPIKFNMSYSEDLFKRDMEAVAKARQLIARRQQEGVPLTYAPTASLEELSNVKAVQPDMNEVNKLINKSRTLWQTISPKVTEDAKNIEYTIFKNKLAAINRAKKDAFLVDNEDVYAHAAALLTKQGRQKNTLYAAATSGQEGTFTSAAHAVANQVLEAQAGKGGTLDKYLQIIEEAATTNKALTEEQQTKFNEALSFFTKNSAATKLAMLTGTAEGTLGHRLESAFNLLGSRIAEGDKQVKAAAEVFSAKNKEQVTDERYRQALGKFPDEKLAIQKILETARTNVVPVDIESLVKTGVTKENAKKILEGIGTSKHDVIHEALGGLGGKIVKDVWDNYHVQKVARLLDEGKINEAKRAIRNTYISSRSSSPFTPQSADEELRLAHARLGKPSVGYVTKNSSEYVRTAVDTFLSNYLGHPRGGFAGMAEVLNILTEGGTNQKDIVGRLSEFRRALNIYKSAAFGYLNPLEEANLQAVQGSTSNLLLNYGRMPQEAREFYITKHETPESLAQKNQALRKEIVKWYTKEAKAYFRETTGMLPSYRFSEVGMTEGGYRFRRPMEVVPYRTKSGEIEARVLPVKYKTPEDIQAKIDAAISGKKGKVQAMLQTATSGLFEAEPFDVVERIKAIYSTAHGGKFTPEGMNKAAKSLSEVIATLKKFNGDLKNEGSGLDVAVNIIVNELNKLVSGIAKSGGDLAKLPHPQYADEDLAKAITTAKVDDYKKKLLISAKLGELKEGYTTITSFDELREGMLVKARKRFRVASDEEGKPKITVENVDLAAVRKLDEEALSKFGEKRGKIYGQLLESIGTPNKVLSALQSVVGSIRTYNEKKGIYEYKEGAAGNIIQYAQTLRERLADNKDVLSNEEIQVTKLLIKQLDSFATALVKTTNELERFKKLAPVTPMEEFNKHEVEGKLTREKARLLEDVKQGRARVGEERRITVSEMTQEGEVRRIPYVLRTRPNAWFGGELETVAERVRAQRARTGGRFGTALSRVAMWGGASGLLYGGISQLRSSFGTMIEVESKMAELKKVMPAITTNFEDMRSAAVRFAKDYGVEITKVLDTMRIFAQQGLSAPDVKEMARVSTLASNVTTMDPAKAAEALTSATRQFNIEGEKAIQILDAWNEVENNFAITSENLADAVKKTGTAAKLVGVDFHTLNGYVTAIGESTRQTGKEIGTSLKFIFSRLHSNKAPRVLKSIAGVETTQGGNIRKGSDILQDLALKWDTLNQSQKIAVAQAMGGIRQYNAVMVLMENYGRALEATAKSINSLGSAERENQIVMETTAKKYAQFKASLQEVAIKASGQVLPVMQGALKVGSGVATSIASVPGGALGTGIIGGYLGLSALGQMFNLSMMGMNIFDEKKDKYVRRKLFGLREWKALSHELKSGRTLGDLRGEYSKAVGKGKIPAPAASLVGSLAMFGRVAFALGVILAAIWAWKKGMEAATFSSKEFADALKEGREVLRISSEAKTRVSAAVYQEKKASVLEDFYAKVSKETVRARIASGTYRSPLLLREEAFENLRKAMTSINMLSGEGTRGLDGFGQAILKVGDTAIKSAEDLQRVSDSLNKQRQMAMVNVEGYALNKGMLGYTPRGSTGLSKGFWGSMISSIGSGLIDMGDFFGAKWLRDAGLSTKTPFERMILARKKILDVMAVNHGLPIQMPSADLYATNPEQYQNQLEKYGDYRRAMQEYKSISEAYKTAIMRKKREFFNNIPQEGVSASTAARFLNMQGLQELAAIDYGMNKAKYAYVERGAQGEQVGYPVTKADFLASYAMKTMGVNAYPSSLLTLEHARMAGMDVSGGSLGMFGAKVNNALNVYRTLQGKYDYPETYKGNDLTKEDLTSQDILKKQALLFNQQRWYGTGANKFRIGAGIASFTPTEEGGVVTYTKVTKNKQGEEQIQVVTESLENFTKNLKNATGEVEGFKGAIEATRLAAVEERVKARGVYGASAGLYMWDKQRALEIGPRFRFNMKTSDLLANPSAYFKDVMSQKELKSFSDYIEGIRVKQVQYRTQLATINKEQKEGKTTSLESLSSFQALQQELALSSIVLRAAAAFVDLRKSLESLTLTAEKSKKAMEVRYQTNLYLGGPLAGLHKTPREMSLVLGSYRMFDRDYTYQMLEKSHPGAFSKLISKNIERETAIKKLQKAEAAKVEINYLDTVGFKQLKDTGILDIDKIKNLVSVTGNTGESITITELQKQTSLLEEIAINTKYIGGVTLGDLGEKGSTMAYIKQFKGLNGNTDEQARLFGREELRSRLNKGEDVEKFVTDYLTVFTSKNPTFRDIGTLAKSGAKFNVEAVIPGLLKELGGVKSRFLNVDTSGLSKEQLKKYNKLKKGSVSLHSFSTLGELKDYIKYIESLAKFMQQSHVVVKNAGKQTVIKLDKDKKKKAENELDKTKSKVDKEIGKAKVDVEKFTDELKNLLKEMTDGIGVVKAYAQALMTMEKQLEGLPSKLLNLTINERIKSDLIATRSTYKNITGGYSEYQSPKLPLDLRTRLSQLSPQETLYNTSPEFRAQSTAYLQQVSNVNAEQAKLEALQSVKSRIAAMVDMGAVSNEQANRYAGGIAITGSGELGPLLGATSAVAENTKNMEKLLKIIADNTKKGSGDIGEGKKGKPPITIDAAIEYQSKRVEQAQNAAQGRAGILIDKIFKEQLLRTSTLGSGAISRGSAAMGALYTRMSNWSDNTKALNLKRLGLSRVATIINQQVIRPLIQFAEKINAINKNLLKMDRLTAVRADYRNVRGGPMRYQPLQANVDARTSASQYSTHEILYNQNPYYRYQTLKYNFDMNRVNAARQKEEAVASLQSNYDYIRQYYGISGAENIAKGVMTTGSLETGTLAGLLGGVEDNTDQMVKLLQIIAENSNPEKYSQTNKVWGPTGGNVSLDQLQDQARYERLYAEKNAYGTADYLRKAQMEKQTRIDIAGGRFISKEQYIREKAMAQEAGVWTPELASRNRALLVAGEADKEARRNFEYNKSKISEELGKRIGAVDSIINSIKSGLADIFTQRQTYSTDVTFQQWSKAAGPNKQFVQDRTAQYNLAKSLYGQVMDYNMRGINVGVSQKTMFDIVKKASVGGDVTRPLQRIAKELESVKKKEEAKQRKLQAIEFADAMAAKGNVPVVNAIDKSTYELRKISARLRRTHTSLGETSSALTHHALNTYGSLHNAINTKVGVSNLTTTNSILGSIDDKMSKLVACCCGGNVVTTEQGVANVVDLSTGYKDHYSPKSVIDLSIGSTGTEETFPNVKSGPTQEDLAKLGMRTFKRNDGSVVFTNVGEGQSIYETDAGGVKTKQEKVEDTNKPYNGMLLKSATGNKSAADVFGAKQEKPYEYRYWMGTKEGKNVYLGDYDKEKNKYNLMAGGNITGSLGVEEAKALIGKSANSGVAFRGSDNKVFYSDTGNFNKNFQAITPEERDRIGVVTKYNNGLNTSMSAADYFESIRRNVSNPNNVTLNKGEYSREVSADWFNSKSDKFKSATDTVSFLTGGLQYTVKGSEYAKNKDLYNKMRLDRPEDYAPHSLSITDKKGNETVVTPEVGGVSGLFIGGKQVFRGNPTDTKGVTGGDKGKVRIPSQLSTPTKKDNADTKDIKNDINNLTKTIDNLIKVFKALSDTTGDTTESLDSLKDAVDKVTEAEESNVASLSKVTDNLKKAAEQINLGEENKPKAQAVKEGKSSTKDAKDDIGKLVERIESLEETVEGLSELKSTEAVKDLIDNMKDEYEDVRKALEKIDNNTTDIDKLKGALDTLKSLRKDFENRITEIKELSSNTAEELVRYEKELDGLIGEIKDRLAHDENTINSLSSQLNHRV